jgi:nucleoside phosphorylase
MLLCALGFVIAAAVPIVDSGRLSGVAGKVVGLASSVIGVSALAVALYRSVRHPNRGPADYKAELRRSIRQQWRAEEVRRRLHDPMPIPVRWRVVSAVLAVQDHWANVTMGDSRADAIITSGTIADLAQAFLRLPSGRLVVIGPPGAGKTTSVTRLLLDLIGDDRAPGPVPVLLSISSWDPRVSEIHRWLADRLASEHAGLNRYAGDGRTIAMSLVDGGHILPILDGLDEMPRPLRSLAIHRLNASLYLGEPVVVTCRTEEYASAVAAADTITAAGVVELPPLGIDDIAGYLRRTTRPGHGTTSKWDPVLTRLRDHPDHPRSQEILAALESPLMLSLAREAYSDTDADPDVLLADARFARAEDICLHLLDLAVPLAYRALSRPGLRDAERARQRLANLARMLDRSGTYNLAWWQLIDMAPVAFAAAIGAAIGAIALFTLSWSNVADIYVRSLLIVLGAAVGAVVGLRHRPAPTTLRWTVGGVVAHLRRSIPGPAQIVRLTAPVGWLAWLVGTVSLLIIVLGRAGLPGVGECAGAVLLVRLLDLWFDVPAEVMAAPTPQALLRTDRATALSRGGLRAGIVGGTVAIVDGPLVGFGFGMSLLVASVIFTAWGRFTAVRFWYALSGQLPWRLMSFLEDAARRGVLRQDGAVYQFRHARLQDRLARANSVETLIPRIESAEPADEAWLSRAVGLRAASEKPLESEPRRSGPISLVSAAAWRAQEVSDVVVIMTALELEYGAVRARLADLRPISHPAGTLFEIGVLPGSQRPVALSAAGEGNQTAAIVAERAAAMFAPRALLFVGIAGALADDIALGDVVVATRVYSYHGGRDQADGFKVRPRAWDASHELEQRARYVSRLGGWAPALAAAGDREPSVHFRPIAAGEVVLTARDSGYASLIERYYNDAVAVEMEGAGVLRAAHLNNSLPALVIRGISDRANADKATLERAGWQNVAAANATAFALSLVTYLP